MKLSLLSDVRILCGVIELSCNSRGDVSLFCDDRMLQAKRGEPRREPQALPSQNNDDNRLGGSHSSAIQEDYPRRGNELQPHAKPRNRIILDNYSFPPMPKSPATEFAALKTRTTGFIPSLGTGTFHTRLQVSKRHNHILQHKESEASVDERYDGGDAQCEALVDTSIETKGIASERAGMSRNTDQPADEERTI